jgi:hypothetical protein
VRHREREQSGFELGSEFGWRQLCHGESPLVGRPGGSRAAL